MANSVMKKAIDGFSDLYEITTDGRVLSARKNGRALRAGTKPGGYAFVGLYLGRGVKPVYKMVHRLVAEAFIPNPCNKPEVNHIDGNKKNNTVENLEWVTRSENAQHGHDIGLFPQGEKHHSTKLTSVDVIRIFHASGKYKDIGAAYGVCAQTVCNIKRKRIHKRIIGVAQ